MSELESHPVYLAFSQLLAPSRTGRLGPDPDVIVKLAVTFLNQLGRSSETNIRRELESLHVSIEGHKHRIDEVLAHSRRPNREMAMRIGNTLLAIQHSLWRAWARALPPVPAHPELELADRLLEHVDLTCSTHRYQQVANVVNALTRGSPIPRLSAHRLQQRFKAHVGKRR